MKQITNREVKTDPVVYPKLAIKHALAVLYSRVREAPLSQLTQHEANFPTLFNEQRLEIVSRSACVSSPETTIIINTITPIIIRMDIMREIQNVVCGRGMWGCGDEEQSGKEKEEKRKKKVEKRIFGCFEAFRHSLSF